MALLIVKKIKVMRDTQTGPEKCGVREFSWINKGLKVEKSQCSKELEKESKLKFQN